jgi:enamine deaminase RidA (YjgF/YER057c/UK114 family)
VRRVTAAVLFSVACLGVIVQGQRQVFPGPAQFPFSAATRADGLVYVAGTIAAEGDIKAQTKGVLDSIAQTLTKAGSSMPMAASVHVYLKNAADFAAMNEVYRTYWPKDPPVRTTIVSDFVVPGALVEISMVAVAAGGERLVIHPKAWMTSPNPYSYGIKSGSTLFLSGLVSRNGKDNSVVEGDMTTQTKTVLDNARDILAQAGMTFDNVVASRVYITDGTKFQEMNKTYTTYFTKDPPARATVVAPLMGPQYLVEITLTASSLPKQTFMTPAADGTPGKPSPILSSAVKVGNRLYVAGLLGNNADNKGNTEAQTKEIMARTERTMKLAGFGWNDVVDGIVYITDVNNFAAMNTGYRSVISKDFPARATVKTGLVSPDGLVEIMFVASK